MIELLVSRGADIALGDKVGAPWPLAAVFRQQYHFHRLSQSGFRALHKAVLKNGFEAVQCLLELGAGSDLQDNVQSLPNTLPVLHQMFSIFDGLFRRETQRCIWRRATDMGRLSRPSSMEEPRMTSGTRYCPLGLILCSHSTLSPGKSSTVTIGA